MRFLYNIGIYCYQTLVKLASFFSNKAKLFHKGRIGLLNKLEKEINHNSPIIWVHCSSVGEFEQSRPIIEWYKANKQEYKILLTFFSPSGYELRKNYPLADWIYYLPVDTPKNARRFLDIVKPAKTIFIKYEFWYNYLKELRERNIPTYIVSAIFRPNQSFFKWYGSFFREMLTTFSALFVQDEQSYNLLKGINLKNEVVICGDTRFDRVNKITSNSKDFPLIRKFSEQAFTIVAGSSWGPDEEILETVIKNFSKLKLIIAPHEIHKEHIEKICKLFKEYKVIRFSQFDKKYTGENVSEQDLSEIEQTLKDSNVLIIDCLGILSSIYRYGKFAYIGGGFGVGIHNILEAATYGIPVVFGPNYSKFKEAKDLKALSGAFPIQNQGEFYSLLDKFIKDDKFLKEKGNICLKYVQSNLGATNKIIGKIEG